MGVTQVATVTQQILWRPQLEQTISVPWRLIVHWISPSFFMWEQKNSLQQEYCLFWGKRQSKGGFQASIYMAFASLAKARYMAKPWFKG